MQEILNPEKITTYVPRIVEVGNFFIINGHVYDKNTFKPIPLDFAVIPTGVTVPMSLKQTVIINHPGWDAGWRNNTIFTSEIVDSEDPSIIYKTFPAYAEADVRIAKFKVTPNGVEVLKTSVLTGNYSGQSQIIGQSKAYIYCSYSRNYQDASANGTHYLMRIQKWDLVETSTHFARDQFMGILDTPNRTYLISNQTNNRFLLRNFFKDDISNIPVMQDKDLTDGTAWNRQHFRALDKINDTTYDQYFMIDSIGNVNNPTSLNVIGISKFRFETVNNSSSYQEMTIDLSKQTDVSSLVKLSNTSTYHRMTHMEMMYHNSEKYILCTFTNNHLDNLTFDLLVDESILYLFKIKNPTTLELVSATMLNDVYSGSLFINGGKTCVMANKYSLKVLTLDLNTMKFKPTIEKAMPVHLFGTDGNENIWVQLVDGSLHRFTNIMPTEIICEYEKESYSYTGSNISTKVSIGARDYTMKYRATKIRISLIGNQIFSESGTNILEFFTSSIGMVDKEVIIKGAGELDYKIEVLK